MAKQRSMWKSFLAYRADKCKTNYKRVRNEHWTGLGLDWIRTTANSVEFGLDPVRHIL